MSLLCSMACGGKDLPHMAIEFTVGFQPPESEMTPAITHSCVGFFRVGSRLWGFGQVQQDKGVAIELAR